TLQGTLTATANSGIATFANLSHNVATNITINFAAIGLTGTNSTTVAVSSAGGDHLVLVQGDSQTATAGSAVAVNPSVRVLDTFNNPVSGVTVTFTVQNGGGSTSATNVATDASGLASTGWTLGTTVGKNNNVLLAEASV